MSRIGMSKFGDHQIMRAQGYLISAMTSEHGFERFDEFCEDLLKDARRNEDENWSFIAEIERLQKDAEKMKKQKAILNELSERAKSIKAGKEAAGKTTKTEKQPGGEE